MTLFLVLGRRNEEDDDFIEIDGTAPAKVRKLSNNYDDTKPTNVCFKQPPIISTMFTDPETKQSKCLVIVTLFSNITEINFDVIQTENDCILKITYNWPAASFSASEMFKKEGAEDTFVNKLHPKFLAAENALETYRENFEDAPLGIIEVKLPASVQLEPNTLQQYYNKKKDGTLLVFFEFLCHRNDYIIKKTEKSISFD